MLVEMTKIEIVGSRELLPAVLQKIHEFGCLHIENISHKEKDGNYVIRPVALDQAGQRRKAELESSLVKISSMLDSLPARPDDPKLTLKRKNQADQAWNDDSDRFLEEVRKTVTSSEEKLRGLNKEKKSLLTEQSNLARYKTVMTKVAPLAGRMVALENYDSMALLVEKKFGNLIEIIRREIDRITESQSHIVADDVDENTIAVLMVFNNKYARQVRSFISGESVNEVMVPENLQSLSYDKALGQIEKRMQQLPPRLKEISKELNKMSVSLYYTLLTKKEVLQDKLDEFDVLDQFGTTDYTFIIMGWMPSKDLAACKESLNSAFGETLYLQELVINEEEAENAPIQFKHSALVKPFEPIVKMFGTPRYGTVDPVPLVAIFFPLFFGIILGDMGYALILIAISFYLRFKKKGNQVLQAISTILLLSGISSFIFGFLYGEFFAELGLNAAVMLGAPKHIEILGLGLPWHRRELLIPTLIFAIGLGAAHIVLGLILGMINARRAHSTKHMLEKGGTLLALVALTPIIFAMITGFPNDLTTPGWLLLIAAIPILVYSAGVMGPIEVLGTLANIVSYARIMAIGLVSVILAETANEIGGSFSNLALGILVAVLIHALNLAIHVFTPSLHVLRLNFVEFFGKFYESGGTPYKPFKRRGGEM